MAWLLEQAIVNGQPGREFWWIAPILDQARIPFRRMKRGLPPSVYEAHGTLLRMTLANGAILVFKGGDHPDSLYGEDVYAAVIDEATRCKDEVFHAIRSTLTATQGPLRIIGNVKGRKNWAYVLARKAEAGEPGWHYAKITAYDAVAAGILPAGEIEDARNVLPKHVFDELYLAEPSDDGGNPFGIKAIADRVGELHITCDPRAWGWDLARSNDWTVGIALCEHGQVCRFERWNQSDLPETVVENPEPGEANRAYWAVTIRMVRDLTQHTSALVDSTGPGGPIDLALSADGFGNIEGYVFSSRSKQHLMERLAIAIQRKEVGFPDGTIRDELDTFEYEYTRSGVKYCVAPNTRILTRDLRYVPADSLAVGDELLAFDEHAPSGPKSRQWRSSVVTHVDPLLRPCYRVTLDDGGELVTSREHLWLVDTGQHHFEWRRTDQLRAPHASSTSPRFAASRVLRLLEVWDAPQSYVEGYLAAAFDGEGSIQQAARNDHPGHGARLTFAQLENGMAARVRDYLHTLGFSWSEHPQPGKTISFGLTGRRAEFLRFLGRMRPARLLARFDPDKLGTLDKLRSVSVRTLEYLGEQPVVALGASTHTFIAEGIASHNSAPAGLHDDCVCALALAVRCRELNPGGSLLLWGGDDESDDD